MRESLAYSLVLFPDASGNKVVLLAPEFSQPEIFTANWAPLAKELVESQLGKLAMAFLSQGLPSALVGEREFSLNGEPYLLLAEDLSKPMTVWSVERGDAKDRASFITFEPNELNDYVRREIRQRQYVFVPCQECSPVKPKLAIEIETVPERLFSSCSPFRFLIRAKYGMVDDAIQGLRRERTVVFSERGKLTQEICTIEIPSPGIDWGDSSLNQAGAVCLRMDNSEGEISFSFTLPGWEENEFLAFYTTGCQVVDNTHFPLFLQKKRAGIKEETIRLFNRLLAYYGPELALGRRTLCFN
jgi:hypothetical protein